MYYIYIYILGYQMDYLMEYQQFVSPKIAKFVYSYNNYRVCRGNIYSDMGL
jgi:hypothetical protein